MQPDLAHWDARPSEAATVGVAEGAGAKGLVPPATATAAGRVTPFAPSPFFPGPLREVQDATGCSPRVHHPIGVMHAPSPVSEGSVARRGARIRNIP